MHDAQFRVRRRQAVQHGGGAVAGAVIDGDDLDVRIVLAQGGQQCFFAVGGFVETGHEDGHQRIAGKQRRLAVLAPFPVPLPMPPEVDAAGHPHAGHEEGIEEDEAQQRLAGQHQREAERRAEHCAKDYQGEQTVDHRRGYHASEMAGRMPCNRGWSCEKSSG
ncbi:hypothetical protein D3C78_1373170 [compost metagenome]